MTTALRRSDTRYEGIAAPWLEWPELHRYVIKKWDLENDPHHSVIGLTGSGKTTLIVEGILRRMCSTSRVLLVDSKSGTDKSLLSAPARPCEELPARTAGRIGRKPEPFDSWHRLVLSQDRGKAQGQLLTALSRVWDEGEWIVAFDELAFVTERTDPGLNLGAPIKRLYRMGRSKHIGLVACTQAPVDVPRAFFDQASFAWIGRIRDEERQKRLLQIGGLTRKELPLISSLQPRQWLFCDGSGDYFARSQLVLTRRGGDKHAR